MYLVVMDRILIFLALYLFVKDRQTAQTVPCTSTGDKYSSSLWKPNIRTRDTDDVARTHILSLDRTKVPGNERYFLASSEPLDLRVIASKLRKEKPEWASRLPEVEVLPTSRLQGKFAKIDTAKADKVFGTDWKSAYESVKETVADVIEWEKKNAA
jgi:nucleoside-diphosphate-sugar epimerase